MRYFSVLWNNKYLWIELKKFQQLMTLNNIHHCRAKHICWPTFLIFRIILYSGIIFFKKIINFSTVEEQGVQFNLIYKWSFKFLRVYEKFSQNIILIGSLCWQSAWHEAVNFFEHSTHSGEKWQQKKKRISVCKSKEKVRTPNFIFQN